jgi:hypothetical protein
MREWENERMREWGNGKMGEWEMMERGTGYGRTGNDGIGMLELIVPEGQHVGRKI